MSRTTDDRRNVRERLREIARTAEAAQDRRRAIRRLAELDRERNRDTYDRLADE